LGYHLSAYGQCISVHQRQSAVDGASHLRDDAIPPAGMERSPVQGRVDFRCLKTKRLRDFRLLAWRLQIGPRVSNSSGLELVNQTMNRTADMPVISKFYGIVIRMLFIQPFVAHFHAFYGDCELVVGINPLKVLQGEAPRRVRSMVIEWALQHQRELLEDWSRLGSAQGAQPIEPLV